MTFQGNNGKLSSSNKNDKFLKKYPHEWNEAAERDLLKVNERFDDTETSTFETDEM